MSFFSNKNKSFKEIKLPTNPLQLYQTLAKDETYSYLRGVQEEVLNIWDSRREDNFCLIKMNTGAGKTLTGLLILYSKMIEKDRPVVYLCPDKQLVSQVIEQSKNFSIPTCEVDEDNDFPEGFMNAKSILVVTVQKLFNGKNIFDKEKITPLAVLIDDAHRCVEKIVDNFTIKISADHELYVGLFQLFKDDLKKQSQGSFEAIVKEEKGFYMKLPFWAWIDKKDSVIKLMANYIGDINTLLFKWDLFMNNYDQHELFIDNRRIEISPMQVYTKNIRAYSNADHVYALSATFVNDYSILKDLNFTLDSISRPIIPNDRKDYGQRLILTPKRYFPKLTQENQIDILKRHLDNEQNVVVLVPNYRIAKQWEQVGARIISKEYIQDEIVNLKTTKKNFVVFVNRYDGVDLSGNSCNVLVIHDHPKFRYIKDTYNKNILHETSSNVIAQTIEQGMGRSVRSSTDYSVIYLVGRHLLKFLRYQKNHSFFNDHTKKQLDMGLHLLDDTQLNEGNVVDKIAGIAESCLNQDQDWRYFYQQHMDQSQNNSIVSKELFLRIQDQEKSAINGFIEGNTEDAIKGLHGILKSDISDLQKAWYYQMLANFFYVIDKEESNNYLIKAKELSRHVLEPFLGKTKWQKQHTKAQIRSSFEFIKTFTTENDLLIYINDIKNKLIYLPENPAEDFENALLELGRLLGYESSRPEKEMNEGCDVLWGSQDYYFIMEAKSQKKATNAFSKTDQGQLSTSLNWFKNKYIFNGEIIGVTLQPNGGKENNFVAGDNIMVLDSSCLEKFKTNLDSLSNFISRNSLKSLQEMSWKQEIINHGFNDKEFVLRYLKNIKK